MIYFFQVPSNKIIALNHSSKLDLASSKKLEWLFGNASCLIAESLEGLYVGPRQEMITPWSTNAVEITQNMGITGIERIEEFFGVKSEDATFDPMLQGL